MAASAPVLRDVPRPVSADAIRVGFVVHVMQVAGAEMLVAETIRRLGSAIEPVVLCLDTVGVLGEELRANGVAVKAFARQPGLDFAVAWRMAKEIRAQRLDVVHAHQYTPFFYGAIAARLSGMAPRVIFTEHGRHYPDVVSTKRRLANQLVCRRLADHVNAVCKFSADSLRTRDGFTGKPIDVIENGVDPALYGRPVDARALRARLGLDPDRRYVTCVARFHPVKDHATLLRGFAEVARVVDDVDLLLVGDGTLKPDLVELSRTLGIDTRTRFMGIRDDVSEILAASDVFALTSVSEAASITLLEAMASGIPVVVTDVGGNPEIVRHGVDGLLAPRGDAPAVTAALIRVLNDPRSARAFGVAAMRRVRQHYRLDRTVARYYELYAGPHGRRQEAH